MFDFKSTKELIATLTKDNGQEIQYFPVIMLMLGGSNYFLFKATGDIDSSEDTLLLKSEEKLDGSIKYYVIDKSDSLYQMIFDEIAWNGDLLN